MSLLPTHFVNIVSGPRRVGDANIVTAIYDKANAVEVAKLVTGRVVHVDPVSAFATAGQGVATPLVNPRLLLLMQTAGDRDTQDSNAASGNAYNLTGTPNAVLSGLVLGQGYTVETAQFNTAVAYAAGDLLISNVDGLVTKLAGSAAGTYVVIGRVAQAPNDATIHNVTADFPSAAAGAMLPGAMGESLGWGAAQPNGSLQTAVPKLRFDTDYRVVTI